MNFTVDWPFLLSSGKFYILRLARHDRISKSSKRSSCVAFCFSRHFICSAVFRAAKLCPAIASVAFSLVWKPVKISVNAITDAWRGTIDSLIKAEMFSISEVRCLPSSVTCWGMETASTSFTGSLASHGSEFPGDSFRHSCSCFSFPHIVSRYLAYILM